MASPAAQRTAFTNCSIYLGKGESIDGGYLVFDLDRILEVGPGRDFAGPRTRGPASDPTLEVFDLGGALVLPGLVDSHIHLVNYAKSLVEIDLADTPSLDAGLEAVRRQAGLLAAGGWIWGRGWDKQRWRLADFPTREILDGAAPAHPVVLTSRDGHLAWLNSAALREAGLADRAPAVEGGEIMVDRSGRPTGVFKEKAANLVFDRVGARRGGRVGDAMKTACARLRRLGLTGVHTIETPALGEELDRAVAAGAVSLNLFHMREVLEPEDLDGLEPSRSLRCVKTYADGTLGSQTASMLEPFCGQPGNLGVAFSPEPKLRRIILGAVEKGFAVSVHAIGDRAVMTVLDAYEAARRSSGGGEALLRIEHAQVLRSEDFPRFARLGVVASMQPIHLVSDRYIADNYWGKRSANAYAWKRILDAGGLVAFGSDAPIESPDPLRGLDAAVTRSDPARREAGAWYPAERLEVWRAVDCYTRGAAAAEGRTIAGAGRPAGRISVGYRPDLTVLDRDIIKASGPGAIPGGILETRVVATVVGGQPEFYT
jgi:predicted amidohydrolase YtcJ